MHSCLQSNRRATALCAALSSFVRYFGQSELVMFRSVARLYEFRAIDVNNRAKKCAIFYCLRKGHCSVTDYWQFYQRSGARPTAPCRWRPITTRQFTTCRTASCTCLRGSSPPIDWPTGFTRKVLCLHSLTAYETLTGLEPAATEGSSACVFSLQCDAICHNAQLIKR